MSKILNGMDHPLSVDHMGGLDSCELVTKVMSDLRLCDHSFCTSLGSLVCWKLTTPVGWQSWHIWSCLLPAATQNLPNPLNKYLIFVQILWT